MILYSLVIKTPFFSGANVCKKSMRTKYTMKNFSKISLFLN